MKICVRIKPRSAAQRFYRCGQEWTKNWREVEVDAATAQRLEEEQMLEVMDVVAANLEGQEALNAADAASAAPNTPEPPGAPPVALATGLDLQAAGEAEARHQLALENEAEAAAVKAKADDAIADKLEAGQALDVTATPAKPTAKAKK